MGSAILANDVPLFIAYVALILMALTPIYFGCFQSLRTPKAALKARKALKKAKAKTTKGKKGDEDEEDEDDDDDDDDDEPAVSETLTSSDAWLFPVVGSCVLFSMYLVFKFLDRKWVDRVLGSYFAVVGTGAVFQVVLAIAAGFVGRQTWRKWLSYKIAITKRLSDKELAEEARQREEDRKKYEGKDTDEDEEEPAGRIRNLLSLRLSAFHGPLFLLSVVPVATFYVTRHWVASNVIALSLSVQAISLMGLDSFLTGSIMLGGLFFYDIFWVFGTEVMVSVARNFDAGPIKILFPKNLPQVISHYIQQHGNRSQAASLAQHILSAFKGAPKYQMTMLGLGDIVIPGIFIALSLRFDQHLHFSSLPQDHLAGFSRRNVSFPKPYFTATLTAYVVGLVTTMAVMHTFQAAQPALLYLSPACVAAVALKSLQRGEWTKVWTWKDEDEEEGKKEKAEAAVAKKDGEAFSSGVGQTEVPVTKDKGKK